MKHVLYKLTSILFVIAGTIHADGTTLTPNADDAISPPAVRKFVPCEKIYIQPEQIAVTNDGIFFQHAGEWIATQNISLDGSGLYVNSISDEWTTHWSWTLSLQRNQ